MITESIGVIRRRPVVQRISHATASALVTKGVPLTVRQAGRHPNRSDTELPRAHSEVR